MSTQIDRLTELAKEDPKRQFYSIAHMIWAALPLNDYSTVAPQRIPLASFEHTNRECRR
jgi:hypothetical protein